MPPPTQAKPRRLQGTTLAVCAVTGVQDEVGDVILPGAFTRTLTKRPVKPVFSHEWKDPIGVCRRVEEWMPGDSRLPKTTPMGEPWPKEAGALVADVAFNLRTTRGRDVYEQVRQWHEEGGGAQWSIGYVVPKGGATKRSGVRFINDLDLYEVSPVLHGAHPLTMSLEVKSDPAGEVEGLEYKATPGPAHGEEMAGQGVMVALYPPPDVAEQLAHPQGTAPEELHITLAYLGQADALGGHPDDLPDEIRAAVAGQPQLEGQLGGLGRFPDTGEGVPVWVPVDVAGLTALQLSIADRLGTSVFSERLHEDHGFTPHLTLGYDLPDDTPAVDPIPVTFDQVYVVRGEEKIPIPLGQPDPADAPAAPTEPAAGPAAPTAPNVEVKTARQAVAAARIAASVETKNAHQAVMEAKIGRPAVTDHLRAQAPGLEEKIMHGPLTGSYEELRARITTAVQTLFKPDGEAEGCWVCVESTYPDHVVVSVEEQGESSTYSIPYENDGDSVVLGAPQRVELTVVAVDGDDPDGDDDDQDEVGPQEAAQVRFLKPAAGNLAAATSAIAVADVDPEDLEELRPTVARLLTTLARKGMPMNHPPAADDSADDGFDDDWEMYSHLDKEDATEEGDGEDGAAPAEPADGGDQSEAVPTAPPVDSGSEEDQGQEDQGEEDRVTLDPEEVEAQLKALNA